MKRTKTAAIALSGCCFFFFFYPPVCSSSNRPKVKIFSITCKSNIFVKKILSLRRCERLSTIDRYFHPTISLEIEIPLTCWHIAVKKLKFLLKSLPKSIDFQFSEISLNDIFIGIYLSFSPRLLCIWSRGLYFVIFFMF